jgi:hypothetical protein
LTFERRAARSPIGPAEDAREYARRLRSLPVDQVPGDFLFSLLNVAQVKLGRRDARPAARRTRDTGRLGPHPRHHGTAGLSGYVFGVGASDTGKPMSDVARRYARGLALHHRDHIVPDERHMLAQQDAH